MRAVSQAVVVDTNVLISAALLPASVPAQLLQAVLAKGRIVFSPATFAEFESRLWRPKFDRYLSLEARKRLLHDFDAVAEWVDPMPGPRRSRDADDDDKFIDAALLAGAELLVSGDADLLDLRQVERVAMLNPAQALRIVDGWPQP